MARRRHNTQTARDRQRLVEDFERRVRYSETGDQRSILRRPHSTAWVVHPAADETELLADSKHSPPFTPEFRGWLADRVTRFLS